MEVQVLWTNSQHQIKLRTDDEVMGMSEEWLVKNGNNYNAKAQVFWDFFHLYKPYKEAIKEEKYQKHKETW
jgi:hypothetical protein